MKRIIVMAVVITFACAGLAQAQDRPVPAKVRVSFVPKATPGSAPSAGIFSKASIDKSVAKLAKGAPAPAPPRRPAYKKAWPYVLGGIAAVLIVYWVTHDSSDPTPY